MKLGQFRIFRESRIRRCGVVALGFSCVFGDGQQFIDVGGRDDVGALLRASALGQDPWFGIDDRRCGVGGRSFCDGGRLRLFRRV